MKLPEPLESQEQAEVVRWLEDNGLKFTSIPNSTYIPNVQRRAINKQQGLRRGLPDLLIIHNQKLLFVEMKRRTKGSLTTEQKEWIEAINTVPNCQAIVARGADDAIRQIEKLLF